MPTSQMDGLRVALEMEKRGKSLYERALLLAEDEELRVLLRDLIAEETKHYTQFSAMMEVFEVPDAGLDAKTLEASKAADFFYPGGLMQVAMDGALESCEALLDQAMQAERDSIAFYGQMLSFVTELTQQEIVMRIIREEMTHLRTLTERKTAREMKEDE